jgi:hypothetical protein
MKLEEKYRCFDTALPQNWLDNFSKKAYSYSNVITYNLITSSTFWVYPKHSGFGFPLSICKEVQNAIDFWNTKED